MTSIQSVSDAVSERVRRRREELNLSLRDVARRLDAIGHTIGHTGLARCESGERRITVEDLLALAFVLDTTPLLLALPLGAADSVEVVPGVVVPPDDAAQWVEGLKRLPGQSAPRWSAATRPVRAFHGIRAHLDAVHDASAALLTADIVAGDPDIRQAKGLTKREAESKVKGASRRYHEILEAYASYLREMKADGLRIPRPVGEQWAADLELHMKAEGRT